MYRKLLNICIVLTLVITISSFSKKSLAGESEVLPAPQLVTNAWMFMAAFKADPDVLKSMLPKGLEMHPDNRVVINMYTVPDAKETSGLGAYTLTYLAIELKDQDSYVMGSSEGYPGRYFIFYFNSSSKMRDFTSKAGIPAQEGHTTTVVKDGKLTATLTVKGKTLIQSTADVGDELGNFGGGHLNYFGQKQVEKDGKKISQVMKYPIPWNGGSVKTENAKIVFKAPKGHPLNKIKPIADPAWAIWTRGSFVYPQPQVVYESEAD